MVKEGVTLVDRGLNGFGTLDGIVVHVDGVPAEASPALLEAEVREHFDKLYDSLWHQVLGVVDYRSRLQRAQKSADAFAEAQQAKIRVRKRNGEQKELLGLCLFDADRAGAVAQRAVAACPLDQGRSDTMGYKLVDWVGNSYMFNAAGLPPFTDGGLAGQRATSVRSPSRTPLFGDNIIAFPSDPKGWHRPRPSGNLTFVDGHTEFFTAITATNLVW